MEGFLGPDPGRLLFAEYGFWHWLAVAVLIGCIALMVVFRAQLRERLGVRRWLPVIVGVVAWVFEITYHLWNFANQTNFVVNLLPFELCAVSLWVAMILAIWRSQALFQYFYFISFGAVLSYAFPDLGGYGPDHFRFWHYFVAHGFILFMCVWCLVVEQWRLRRDAFVRFLAVMVPYAAIIYVVDQVFSVNYLFLAGPTSGSSPLDFFGTGWAYVAKFAGLALVVFFGMYLAAPKERRGADLVEQYNSEREDS
ncbi:MAG: TIGR02206 family membrane protein [Propionibacteriaceae bacterium]|jgi:hypothetical integral membrane protein (TIGR02206 family)|nr:TIGR02206 family membrane protein [Propionibacteriaceae bacterium]